MNRTRNRITSLLLCLMMLLSLLPAQVFAAANALTVEIIPENPTVAEGDTANFTIVATGEDITAIQFELQLPKGMTYVPGSAKIPAGLQTTLGWAALDWTESSMMWTSYSDLPLDIPKGTVLLTFSCVMETAGTYRANLRNLMCFDANFQEISSQYESEPISVRAKEPEIPAFFYAQVSPNASTVNVGDTVHYTVSAIALDTSALEFKLNIPDGMTYVPGSAKVPNSLLEDLEWAEVDWTEETMKWTGYNHIGVTFPEGTILLTFSCVVNRPGNYQVTLEDLLPVDGNFVALESVTNFDYLDVVGNANVQIPTLTAKYPTVSFEDVIILNIYFDATDTEDVVEMGMMTFPEKYTAADIALAEEVIPGHVWNEGAKLYTTSTNGIAAKELGKTIYFAVYAKLTDGSYAYSKISSYSVEKYAKTQLSSGNAAMKALMVATLNYAAAAQVRFDYNADALVNASLTAEQKALVIPYNDSMISAAEKPDTAKLGEMVKTGNYTRFYPTVSFEGAFSINYYFVPTTAPVGDVTMYVWTKADYEEAGSLSKANASYALTMELLESGEYRAIVENIAAKQLNDALYVSICYKTATGNYCSGATGYSIGLYCKAQAAKTGAMADLAKATAVYGYYAKQRFG